MQVILTLMLIILHPGSHLRAREQHPDRRTVLPDQHVGQAPPPHLRAHLG